MNQFGLEFHHFGLAVRDPALAFKYLGALGYRAGASCFDPLQKVNLAMRHHDVMPDVEVVWPGDGPSPIDQMLKRSDSLVYHLCYTSEDVDASLASIESSGLDVLPITEPLQAPLFENLPVSFYNVGGIGLIEIIHLNAA
jgi:hypothetical protein